MTSDEAKVIFYDCQLDLDECYRDRLFEFKQYFVVKPIIAKLFQSKLQQLRKLNLAYEVLTGKKNRFNETNVLPNFNDLLEDSFNIYFKAKNTARQQISLSKSGIETVFWVEQLVQLQREFALHVCGFFQFDKVDALVSQEPDPMLLVHDIKSLNSEGIYRFHEIDLNGDQNSLVQEIKRLHLWSQY